MYSSTKVRKLRLLNHVVFVIDDSGSMAGLRNQVSQVFDNQVAELARLDEETGQETHVSVYIFGQAVVCTMYDTDVKRIKPGSLFDGYADGGWTALIHATLTALEELEQTAQLHGDHAFLLYLMTDGEENHSNVLRKPVRPFRSLSEQLQAKLGGLPSNWTAAAFVPNHNGLRRAVAYGWHQGNVMIWDVSAEGLRKAEGEMRISTQSFYDSRSSGITSTKTLFSTVQAKSVTQADVNAASLTPVDPSEFVIVPVALSSSSKLEIKIPNKSKTRKNPDGIKHVEIMPFVEESGRPYVAGNAFYRLTKSEKYYYGKGVALVHRTTRKVYRGPECEKLIGLDSNTTRIKPPTVTDEYEVYVRSTSFTRQVEVGGSVLLFLK